MSKGTVVRNNVLAGEEEAVEVTEGKTEQERRLEPPRGLEVCPQAVRSQREPSKDFEQGRAHALGYSSWQRRPEAGEAGRGCSRSPWEKQ